MTFRFLPFFI